jgi:predicted DNA-binding transcriptional regulator AlpA
MAGFEVITYGRIEVITEVMRGHQPNPLQGLYTCVRTEGLLLIGETCRRLGISPSTYWRLESDGTSPKAERWVALIRFRRHPAKEWRVRFDQAQGSSLSVSAENRRLAPKRQLLGMAMSER